MIDQQILRILRCPITLTPLRLADETTIARVNAAIPEGTLKTRSGQAVTRPLDAGLVSSDGRYLLPIYDGIPTLMADDAIPLDLLFRDR